MLMKGDGSGSARSGERCASLLLAGMESKWTRDCLFQRAAFDSDTFTGSISLNVYEVETGIERNLTGDQLPHAVLPSWSPDDSQIVFVSNLIQRRNGGGIDPLDGDIYTVPANGGPVRNVTQNRIFDDSWVQWSPSGERLLILTSPGDWSAPAKSRLYLLDLASDELRRFRSMSGSSRCRSGHLTVRRSRMSPVATPSTSGRMTDCNGCRSVRMSCRSFRGRQMGATCWSRRSRVGCRRYVVTCRIGRTMTSFELGYDSMSGANGPPIWGGITPLRAPSNPAGGTF